MNDKTLALLPLFSQPHHTIISHASLPSTTTLTTPLVLSGLTHYVQPLSVVSSSMGHKHLWSCNSHTPLLLFSLHTISLNDCGKHFTGKVMAQFTTLCGIEWHEKGELMQMMNHTAHEKNGQESGSQQARLAGCVGVELQHIPTLCIFTPVKCIES